MAKRLLQVWAFSISVAILLVTPCYAGLLHQWDLDDGSGTTVSADVGLVTGTLGSGSTWQSGGPSSLPYYVKTDGQANGGIRFSGVSSPTNITLSFWAKSIAGYSNYYYDGRDLLAKSDEYRIYFYGTGRLQADFWNSTGTLYTLGGYGATNPYTSSNFVDRQWHKFSLTISQGTASLYVDNNLVHSISYTGTRKKNSSSLLWLGNKADGNTGMTAGFGGPFQIIEVPEPSSMVLLSGILLLGAVFICRRRCNSL